MRAEQACIELQTKITIGFVEILFLLRNPHFDENGLPLATANSNAGIEITNEMAKLSATCWIDNQNVKSKLKHCISSEHGNDRWRGDDNLYPSKFPT